MAYDQDVVAPEVAPEAMRFEAKKEWQTPLLRRVSVSRDTRSVGPLGSDTSSLSNS
jgi:hypothetical protein